MFEKILVPLDGSLTAEAIIPQVRQLLKQKDAEVILLHSLHLSPPPDGYYASLIPTIRKDSENYIEKVRSGLEKDGVKVRVIMKEGLPAEVILEVAEQEKVSLIAMSSHGRSGPSRWVFGSATEKVLRASTVPLLVTRSTEEHASSAPTKELSMGKILLPTDTSEVSNHILPLIIKFSKIYQSEVTLLYVIEPGLNLRFIDEAVGNLKTLSQTLKEEGVSNKTMTLEGTPVKMILEACKKTKANLLAMSTHGRSGVSRLFLGSVAEKVLRASTLPVLLAPSSADGDGK